MDFRLKKSFFSCWKAKTSSTESIWFRIVKHYQACGFGTAIDDFGAGYAGLGLLAEYQPDYLKIDMKLIRNIDQDCKRQIIVEGIADVARKLNIRTVAEGVETRAEAEFLFKVGVSLMQGYYFAKPAFRSLPEAEEETLSGFKR